jgi:hypothetical protein
MKNTIKSLSFAIVIALFSSCSNNDENATVVNKNTAKPTVQAAPTQPILIVQNYSSYPIVLSLLAAQAQFNPDPYARMFYKSGAGTSPGFPVIPAGTPITPTEVKFLSFDNATPSGFRPPSWAVSNYVNPALSGYSIPNSTVQSTYNTAYWSGLYIQAMSGSTFFRNYPVGAGTGDRRFIGQTSYGDFNPTLAGNFGTPYTQINFGPAATTLIVKAIWTPNLATGDVNVIITNY